jgi:prefoldin subunit 5
LEEAVHGLRDEISALREQKSELEESMKLVLEQKGKATKEMRSFFEAKQELDKYKIDLAGDLKKFAETVRGIAEYGYAPKKVLEEFESINDLMHKRDALSIAIANKQENLSKLSQHERSLQNAISLHSEKVPVYNALENIGFGSTELKLLLNTVLEITCSNGINHWLAVNKFFKDVRTKYDAKLGFESEIEDLRQEIQILEEERKKMSQSLQAQHFVGPIVVKLLQLGLSEDDIVKAGKLYLDLLTGTYSVEDLAKGMADTVDMMIMSMHTTSRMEKTDDQKLMDVLGRVQQNLSKLDPYN